MSNNIFDLVYSDYDWQEHYFFNGPEGTTLESFRKSCDDLLPKAGYKVAFRRSFKGGGRICWSDVVDALVLLLEEHGYQRVPMDSYTIGGGFIISPNDEKQDLDVKLGFSWQAIVNYNSKLEKKLAEERKAKRNLRIGLLKKKTVQIIK